MSGRPDIFGLAHPGNGPNSTETDSFAVAAPAKFLDAALIFHTGSVKGEESSRGRFLEYLRTGHAAIANSSAEVVDSTK